jgi:hypothetical protein
MSIYATLWALQFPRFGEFHIGCEWITVIAQGVPAHVGADAPDPYTSFLPALPKSAAMKALILLDQEASARHPLTQIEVVAGQDFAPIWTCV